MTVTKLTKSGKVEIYSEIIDWLKLQPGDSIDFTIAPDGLTYNLPKLMSENYLECCMKQAKKRFL